MGRRDVVVIDPGPRGASHLDAIVESVRGAESVQVVVTHGHRDHAPAAFVLGERVGVDVSGPQGLPSVDRPLSEGDVLSTDEGDLVVMDTPGHARHHLALHWPARRALFAGDLLLGRGNTTWVGEYPGCVADYLASLRRLSTLHLDRVYPAHGDPIEDPGEVIARYQAHRLERVRQVREALEERPGLSEDELLEVVYGTSVASPTTDAALRSIRALMEHVGYGRLSSLDL